MPTQVNGIGTTYLGEANLESYEGVCEKCRNHTLMKSYETGYWFTFLFIPVIPLGRKQILDYCSICTYHRAVPFNEWEKIKNDAIDTSVAELAENQDDPIAAMKLHDTYVTFGKTDEANQLGRVLQSSFPENVDVLMYLGTWHEQNGRETEADECFAKAFALEPDNPATIRAAGVGMLQEGKLEEAHKTLSPLLPPSENYDPSLFYLLATAYQGQGNSQQAHELYEMMLKHSPELAGDKTFRSSVRETEAALDKQESLVGSESPLSIFSSQKFWWPVGVAALLGLLFYWNWHIASNRTLHIVNGLPAVITVKVDNTQVRVPANGVQEITIPEGSHTAQVVEPSELTDPIEFQMSSNWFRRYFSSPVFVLDPGQTSALIWEETVYKEFHALDEENNYDVYLAKPFTYIADIDYAFQQFPDQLQVEGSKSVTKTRIGLLDANPLEVAVGMPDKIGPDQTLDLAERFLSIAPHNEQYLSYYVYFVVQLNQFDRGYDFLEKGLASQPINVQWHRRYQWICGMRDREIDLVAKYDAMLQNDPDNSNLIYLRSRLEQQATGSIELCDKAIKQDESNYFAWSAKGYNLLAMGEFEKSIRCYDRAVQLQPTSEELQDYRDRVRLALKQFDPLEAELRMQLNQEKLNFAAANSLVFLSAAKGDPAEAEKIVQQFQQNASNNTRLQWSIDQLKSALYYVKQEYDKILQLHESPSAIQKGFNMNVFAAHLEKNDLPAAAKAIEALNPKIRTQYELCLSIAYQQQGNPEKSREWLDRAIESMPHDAAAEYIIELLRRDSQQPVTLEEALDISEIPQFKSAILVKLGLDSGEQGILDLAEKLNFDRSFPYHFLNRAIQEARNPKTVNP